MAKLWLFISLLVALLVVLLWQALYREYVIVRESIAIIREGRIQNIDLSGMRSLQQGPLTVYFMPGHEGLAAEVIRTLANMSEVIHQRLGINLGPIAVAIILLEEGQGGVLIAGAVNPILLFRPISSLQEAEQDVLFSFYLIVPHEEVEIVIASRLYHDPAARWIGDGLAEYASIIFVDSQQATALKSRILKSRAKDVRKLQEEGLRSYNLIKQFLVRRGHKVGIEEFREGMSLEEIAGYGVALAF